MKSKKLLLVTMLIGALYVVSCGTKYVTTEQVINNIDSLSSRYYVDYKPNVDYLNSHPLKKIEKDSMMAIILKSSPAMQKSETVSNQFGTFSPRPIVTKEDSFNLMCLCDSLIDYRPVDISWYHNTIDISDQYSLSYNLGFYGLKEGNMRPILNENFRADVINKKTGEKTQVELKELSYGQLNKTPLVYAFAFWVEFEEHRYLIHGMHDVRIYHDKLEKKMAFTDGCYMIR